ncbi:MAG: SpoIIE family protein phosphatase [Gammaproteobacteria bacterium]|nr:SpoIIE family protein phosphatase [Gammaproteobacteria bacterium]
MGKIYQFSINNLHIQATQRAQDYAARLDAQFKIVAQIANNTATFMESVPPLDEDSLFEILRSNVERNPMIYGSAIAFAPYKYDANRRLFSPYVYRSGSLLQDIDIGSQSYDYTEDRWEWFVRARNAGKPIWTEPYYDEGAGNILMNTFSVPFYQDGNFLGVATIDIALDKLQKQVGAEHLMDLPFIIVSPSGRFITHPDQKMIMHETIQHQAKISADPKLQILADGLLSGKSGIVRVDRLENIADEPLWIFYAPIRSTGWAFATAVSEKSMLSFANTQITRGIFGVAVLIMLVIISVLLVGTHITKPIMQLANVVSQLGGGHFKVRMENIRAQDEVGDLARAFNDMVSQLKYHINALTREAASREAVESEMRVAREIQASLLPNIFPPYPDHAEFDLCAANSAARHVGGDFFDYFFISDDKLILVIADVSGKGTPAAIVMAVARTIIRNLARTIASPAQLLSEANRLLLETHINPVFITMFIAIYHPATGGIVYANAGHQPPYLLDAKSGIGKLGQATGTVVGMLDDAVYEECAAELHIGEYLIAYTDGIPDARNPDGQFYGEAHFTNLLSSCAGMTAREICDIAINEVTAFQAKDLADDITLLVLKRNH